MQTLEDLKRANAEAEAKEAEIEQTALEDPQPEPDEQAEAGEEEVTEEDESAEDEDSETTDTEPEAWMTTDEQASDDSVPVEFTRHDIANAKKKQRLKLERQHNTEIEQLRAEIEQLKTAKQVPATINQPPEAPVPSDFATDAEWQTALAQWVNKQVDTKLATRDETVAAANKQREIKQQVDQSVEDHYRRASKLVKDNGISPEVYQKADLDVREAIDSIRPGEGDAIVEWYISRLGEGSDKVMYYLGRNPTALARFQRLISSDPSGIEAGIFLGEEKKRLTGAQKTKLSQARKPATQINGDDKAPLSTSKMKKQYEAAHKKGDVQKAYDLKQKARLAGGDVSNW